ncbi:glycosyltransferase [Chryseobacterium camelliae]|uniref:Glycosyltransferase n=1 Tax=Chryseobacterium camelliae TaxID=1265445 RepID=A0ABY7QSH2_9FLAO|nr:glycosyltransferase [Chryseobacterium camelliae]WBV61971.1 glycosyltransferase [Chryseobacterium camelliae]
MGIKRFFKNKIKDYRFIKNRRRVSVDLLNLDFFKSHPFNIPTQTNPEVSIIIHSINDLKMILNCLYAIEKYDQNISKEIIVINEKNVEAQQYLEKIKGISLLSNKESNGLTQTVNLSIEKAKGKFIYLLDSHTLVQENYLSSLMEVFKVKENAGAVGSKMISLENTVIEAGNLVFKNAEIIELGKSEAIDTPQFNFLRKVNFCAGSLLFHKINKNGDLNLLNETFSSLYFAEADLCLNLKKEKKLETYYHPFSEIACFDNSFKAGTGNDKENFVNYWKSYFADREYVNNEKIDYSTHYKAPNFLFLEENMPKPDQDSGSRRFLEIIKILQKNNHKITLAVRHFDEVTDLAYVKFFRGIGVEVCMDYVTLKDKIVKVADQVKEAIRSVDIIWLFRPIGFDYWYQDIKYLISGKKLVYDMVDLHYLRMERENKYIEVTKDREKLIDFFREKEYFGMNTVDAVVSISDEEKNAVSKNGVSYEKIFTVSNIHQAVHPKPVDFLKRDGLLFIGGYNHLPNIDAVKFLHNEIMPLVWEKNKEIKIFILGPDFPEELKQEYHSEQFQILGFQKSVDHWFENARVFVAPLRYGAGVKGKIGQALEFKLPVVTTGIGAEGMSLEDRKTALISDENPQNFADKILELYDNEQLWQTLHENSLLPLSKFSIETQEENIKKMLAYLGFED